MLRLGMLGSDGGAKGGHAALVSKIINQGEYDAKIVAVCGNDRAESEELANAMDMEFVADKPEELLGKVDAVMVMHRNGNYHLENALPFIHKGLPVFIDKPFTCTVKDAEKLAEELAKNGSVICGGTYAKYAPEVQELKKKVKEKKILSGYVSFPLSPDTEYGGIHFYSHHLIEEMLTVFGENVISITSSKVGDNLVVIAKYPDFPVIMNYASNYGGLHIGAYFDDDTSVMASPQIFGHDVHQCEEFLKAIESGKGESAEYFVKAVKISNGILKSLEKKSEIILEEEEL